MQDTELSYFSILIHLILTATSEEASTIDPI